MSRPQESVRATVPPGVRPVFLVLVLGLSGPFPGHAAAGGGEAEPEPPAVLADAGDDQIGLVGRQITLNGGRSLPRGRVGFRWLQLGGPQLVSKTQEGAFLTFTPQSPGIYRFALLVASGSVISEPDSIEVAVGTLNTTSPPAGTPTAPAIAPPPSAAQSIEELARGLLATVASGPEAAAALASTFEAVADRMDLYASYADLFSELSRRLEAFIPSEPRERAVWVDRVFTPLTGRLVERMRLAGLDLTRPESASQPMSPAQKACLAEQYRSMAQGFRATRHPQ